MSYDTYRILKMIADGEIKNESPLVSSDALVINVSINKSNPQRSVVKLVFGDRQTSFFQIFSDKSNDWEVDFANNIYHFEYHDWESFDWDRFTEVFLDGEYFNERELTNEQQETLREILSILDMKSSHDLFDLENRANYSKTFFDFYETYVEDFFEEEISIRDNCEVQSMRESMEKTESNILFKYNIFVKNPFYVYYTNVDTLINLYEKTSAQDKDILGLLTRVVYEDSSIDGLFYEEYKYEYDCMTKYWDDTRYSNAMTRMLDRILEKVESEFETDDQRKEFMKFYKFISSKYTIGKWYFRKPETKGYNKIKIDDIDKQTLDLIVTVDSVHSMKFVIDNYSKYNKNDYPKKVVKMEYDQFLNFLNQPTLFDD